jgi:peptidoglycan/LPS O-acetylase OafA/YrhL
LKDVPFRAYDFLCNLIFLNGAPGFVWRLAAYAEASWSLFYEACFYLSMPCLLLAADRAGGRGPLARLLRPALVLSVALLVYGQMPRFVMFFFGVMVGSFGDNGLKRLAEQLSTRWVLAAYLAACAAFSFGALRTEYFIPIFGPAASVLFIKSCWGRGFLNGLFSLSALRGFGNISYSFYLTHISCVILVAHWLKHPLASLPMVPAYAIFLAACMALSLSVAVVSFAVCERWYFRKAKPRSVKQDLQEPPTILPFVAGKAA